MSFGSAFVRRGILYFFIINCSFLSPAFGQEDIAGFIEQAAQVLVNTPSFPDALQASIVLYQKETEQNPNNAKAFEKLAWACLELGEIVVKGKLEWYQRSHMAAKQSLALNEASAQGHFLYALTKGLIVEDFPFWKLSPKTPFELERHLLRALEIEPNHARALNMMGMLLNKVPGPLRMLMKGKRKDAEGYLIRAVQAEPTSTRLRLLLAEYYYEEKKLQFAKEQAKRIMNESSPKELWLWENKHKRDAVELLSLLGE